MIADVTKVEDSKKQNDYNDESEMSTSIKKIDNDDIVVENYIPIVMYIASKVITGKSKYMEFDDLVGYGMIGLMDAISKFDKSKGMKFSTYASIRIKGAMIDEIRKNSPVSKGIADKLNKYNKAVEVLRNTLMREPGVLDIANYLDLSVGEVGTIENYVNYVSKVSLENMIFSDDDNISLINTIKDTNSPNPESALEDKEVVEYLGQAIDSLREKDKKVIYYYYIKCMTLKEIGKILKVSESRVCQIHNRALKNLKTIMEKYYYDKRIYN
ncbi:sigma-70 family RNA polymerase sigma factor [Candidatus Arthromitus sp. SFB-rat-Yit]|uniref:sigma-70 family RNA polymerase sigma factor n=1 Tax=Candidatus Arthromitus sp. SFB-rat-Yit TaxID=1041504 RepID=UPI000227A406|nr:FliA/WhiG family RNA polymerase sigma factor [Candidatus Arthromitus sp. SFB-rat-Yit]BAK81510.1 RNA polymerase sigma factor for flagellar operon [Candidatus Arthromitus sp. SFB-rat-Yit]